MALRRSLTLAGACVATVLAGAFGYAAVHADPARPHLFVSPDGSPTASCTRTAPCRSLDRAYRRAAPGQVVELRGGTYPAQRLGAVTKPSATHVLMRPARGARVRFGGTLTLDGATHLTLSGLRLARPGSAARSLIVRACTSDVTLRGVDGETFFLMEGTSRIRFEGGAWGGYSEPGQEDSAIGTSGATGPTERCGGAPASPARDIRFTRVTFHDVFWGVPSDRWGGSHPDCFEVNGFVDGLTVRDSRFVRCASTFMQINGDQGDMRHLRFEGNRFSRLGADTYYGIQITSEGKPGLCGGVTFRHNTYLPANPHARTWPDGPIRTDCEPLSGSRPARITGNLFTRSPPPTECSRYRAAPYDARWEDNLFGSGRCGAGRGLPFGYRLDARGLSLAGAHAAAVRRLFRLAAGGARPTQIARRLRAGGPAPAGGWSTAAVRRVGADRVYLGGRYGARGANPPLVRRATWRAAQPALR